MKVSQLFLSAALFLVSLSAFADIQPVASGSPGEQAANVANDVFSVTRLRLGGLTYKIVSMDSALNGDLNSTTMVLVGQEVGGAAGYEAAFQLSPVGDAGNLKSAKIQNGAVALTFSTFEGGSVTKIVRYDAVAKTLKEVSAR